MEDLDQDLELELPATEETVDEGAPAAAEPEVVEEAPAEGEAGAELGEEEKAELDAEEAEGDEEESEEPVVDLKFKAGVYNKETKALEQKEFEIDPRFASIMKTPEDVKLVQELHQKAFGLESVKERLADTRMQFEEVSNEKSQMESGINELRGIYQGAVSSGNFHKLDKFFSKLQIPQEVVLNYALAKVQLNEMDPAQKQMLQGQLDAENRAEEQAQQRAQLAQQVVSQEQQANVMQTDFILQKPEVAALAQEFDSRFPDKVAKGQNPFREAVFAEGNMAYHASRGTVKLTPQQAINNVIEKYALKSDAPMVPKAQQLPGSVAKVAQVVPAKPKVATMPNVQGRSASPLKPKVRSIEDIKKYSKETYG